MSETSNNGRRKERTGRRDTMGENWRDRLDRKTEQGQRSPEAEILGEQEIMENVGGEGGVGKHATYFVLYNEVLLRGQYKLP